jgi:hypothetical protein
MYQVLCDDRVLHDVRDEEYQLIAPKISLELNKTGNFDFGILPSHPNEKTINKLKSRIEVYEDSELLFKGRSLTDEIDFKKLGQVSCEGELAFLLDSVQRPHTYGTQSVEIGKADTNVTIFKRLIDEHNAQVEDDKKFTIGTVDIDSVSISSLATNYEKTWDFISSNFLDKYEGYLRVRHENSVRYLDYVKLYGKISNQTIRFGENLLDLKKYTKAEELKTAIIPVGANGITVKTANGHDGTDYVYSQPAVDLYGWIYEKVDFSDVTSPDTLLAKAKDYLNHCINLAITIELTAIDLHMIDVDMNGIRLGDLVPCVSEGHGLLSVPGDISTYYLVSKYEIDLENPGNNKITLGRTISTLSDKVANNVSSAGMIEAISQNANNALNAANNAVDEINGLNTYLLDRVFPVGSVYFSVNPSNPYSIIGGRWVQIAQGKTIVGVDVSDSDFNIPEKTGGNKNHKHSTGGHVLTASEMPSHNHSVNAITTSSGGAHTHNLGKNNSTVQKGSNYARPDNYGSGSSTGYKSSSAGSHSHSTPAHNTNSNGSNDSHSHGDTGNATTLQPYITLYIWKRTS